MNAQVIYGWEMTGLIYAVSLVICTISIKAQRYTTGKSSIPAGAAMFPVVNSVIAFCVTVDAILGSAKFLINWVPERKENLNAVKAEADDFLNKIKAK
jgi:hypothetical protein